MDNLPAEIVHQILLLAPQSSVLSFGLTNHRNYVLCLPALHHRITLTERTLPLLHFPKIAHCDPALRWVQELQLGGASDDASGWDVLSDASILTVFPNLRFVDARPHTPVRGWAGVLHVIDTLPVTTRDYRGRAFCLGDSNIWSLDVSHRALCRTKLTRCRSTSEYFHHTTHSCFALLEPSVISHTSPVVT